MAWTFENLKVKSKKRRQETVQVQFRSNLRNQARNHIKIVDFDRFYATDVKVSPGYPGSIPGISTIILKSLAAIK